MCQKRRSESWKRISCRYQVRRMSWRLEFWARHSCKEIPIRSVFGFPTALEKNLCRPIATVLIKRVLPVSKGIHGNSSSLNVTVCFLIGFHMLLQTPP